MKTFGETLRTARTAHGWSIERLSQQCAVRAEWITAYEKNDHINLPPPPFRTGYIPLLAAALGTPVESWLALARRDLLHSPRTTLPTPSRRRFRLSAGILSRTLFLGVMALGMFWLTWQWGVLTAPPPLSVQTPLPYEVVSSPVQVAGTADPQASLTINGQLVSLDQSGNFRTELSLSSGEHVLVIQARDQQGRHSEKTLFFTVE